MNKGCEQPISFEHFVINAMKIIIPWWGRLWHINQWKVRILSITWKIPLTAEEARVENNMAFEQGSNHKHGPLKQQNKKHKHGRHRSKSEIDRVNKGWVMKLFSFIQVNPKLNHCQNCVELQVELELKSSQRKVAKLPEKLIGDNRWKSVCKCALSQIRIVQLPKPVCPYDYEGLHWLYFIINYFCWCIIGM